jgi:hypothetical protein
MTNKRMCNKTRKYRVVVPKAPVELSGYEQGGFKERNNVLITEWVQADLKNRKGTVAIKRVRRGTLTLFRVFHPKTGKVTLRLDADGNSGLVRYRYPGHVDDFPWEVFNSE